MLKIKICKTLQNKYNPICSETLEDGVHKIHFTLPPEDMYYSSYSPNSRVFYSSGNEDIFNHLAYRSANYTKLPI